MRATVIGLFLWLEWPIISSGTPRNGLIESVNVFMETITSAGNAQEAICQDVALKVGAQLLLNVGG